MGLSVESWEQLGRRTRQCEDYYSSLTLPLFPSSAPDQRFSGFPVQGSLKWCHWEVFPLESDELMEGDSYRAAVSGFLAQGLKCWE